jgi:hypothetical protein
LDSGNRSGAEGGGVGTGTLFGFGIKSRGICGVGVGEGELKGEGDGDGAGEEDALGCAFWAFKVTPIKQKTITKRTRTMMTFDILIRVRWKKRAFASAVRRSDFASSPETPSYVGQVGNLRVRPVVWDSGDW